jgi:outer membrane lipoprotein-sorting protein
MKGMRFIEITSCVVLVLVCGLAQVSHGQEPASAQPSVVEIVDSANRVAYYQGKDGRASVSMTITDSQGRTRNREFTILRRDEPPKDAAEGADAGDEYCRGQQFYVYFNRPADVSKMVFMVWKHVDKDDDRWLYLPALDLVKRIAATDERTSFVGSEFFYEDVSGRNTTEDDHEMVETTDNYYVLKNTPKDPKAVEFAHYKMWVHRSTFVMVKAEYYDKNGAKYREYEAIEVKTIEGYPTVTKSRMKDLRTNGNTVIEYSDLKYNIGLPEDVFTERYLRRPPLQYLR